MNAVALLQRLHEHRRWANRQLWEAAEQLTPEELREEHPVGQGSLWRTLTHLLAAEYVWLEAMLGNEDPLLPGDTAGGLPGNQRGDAPFESLASLLTYWRQLDVRWQDYLSQLSEPLLDQIVRKSSTTLGPGTYREVRRGDVLLHVCTHAQYTTAQAVNMLRRLGVRPLPDVMLISLAHEERACGPSPPRDAKPRP